MTGRPAYPFAHPPTGGGGIIWGPWIRARRREGVGREVRKWDIVFFSSSYHCHLLACLLDFVLVVMRLVLVSSCVSCLLVVLRGRVFSFRRSFVVRSSFSRRLRVRLRSIVPASRFLRLVCACRVSGAIALMGYEMRNRVVSWGRGMIGNGVRLFVVLVLLACPPFARRDTIVEAATPPPCLLACRYERRRQRRRWPSEAMRENKARTDEAIADEMGNARLLAC